ncbi:hypothetical protein [Thermotoga profunda]|uniref:hypothetical protein n=1 Tax=Thermotoga profunda TaxID=1508420 RepID=UPI000596EEED|nr:hypothetical protein [Thermotoga profunda]
MVYERYAKAIEKVLGGIVQREHYDVDISEIWIETSIPQDLIIEIIEKIPLQLPETLHSITLGDKILWKRKDS